MPTQFSSAAQPQSFQLSGPSSDQAARFPARGDIAHIALAGEVFVPHYVVPMVHRATDALPIMVTPHSDSSPAGALCAGDLFEVLDFSGGWAWGGLADGPVGYVRADGLVLAE